MIPEFTFVRPHTLKEAASRLAAPGARLIAGGTDLLGCLRDGVFDAQTLVSIAGLPKLREVEETPDGGLRIGALVTLAELAAHPAVKKRWPALAAGAAEAASPQLRNQGTIGGNLCQKPRCWYYRGEFHCSRKGGERCFAYGGENRNHCILGGYGCYIVHPSDTAPALVAYGALVEIVGSKGSRKVPVEKFHVLPEKAVTRETVLEPGEIVTHVVVPSAAGVKSSYRKVRERRSWDFPLAGVALSVKLNGGQVLAARMVLAGAAPVPWRCVEAEKGLVGRELTGETAARAAEAALSGAKPLEHNGYKIPLFRGLIVEELLALAGG